MTVLNLSTGFSTFFFFTDKIAVNYLPLKFVSSLVLPNHLFNNLDRALKNYFDEL